MKKNLFYFIVSAVFLMISSTVYSATLKSASAAAPPVELEKGWNLISVPCDIDTSLLVKGGDKTNKLEKKENDESEGDDKENGNVKDNGNDNGNNGNDKETKFFKWNGTGYEEVTYLYRGVGYIVNTNNIQNTSSVCDNSNVVEPMEISLKKGWNLVGNPYHKSYKVEDIFGEAVSSIELIYEYSGNKYSELKNSDHFKPWRGYWVFVGEDVTVPVFISCDLKISADKSEVKPEETVLLEAVYLCTALTGEVESYDVIEDAEWASTNEEAGTMKNGVFTAIADGNTEISATYKEIESNTLTITVRTPPEFECDRIIVAQHFEDEINSDGYCGNYAYFTGHFSDDNSVFHTNGAQCQQCGDNGNVMCRYNYRRGHYSCNNEGYCTLDTSDGTVTPIPLLWHNIGEIPLKAICLGKNSPGIASDDYKDLIVFNTYEDITSLVSWTITENNDVFTLNQEGRVEGVKTGSAYVSAEYAGITSSTQRVIVVDTDNPLFVQFSPSSINVAINGEAESRLFAVYRSPGGECDDEYEKSHDCNYRREDITDKAEFTVKGNLVTYEGGIVKGGEKVGSDTIKAEFGGKSATLYAKVYDPNEVVKISFQPISLRMAINGESEARLIAAYKNFSGSCVDVAGHSDACEYRYEDVTENAEYTLFNNMITYKNGVVTAGDKVGSTYIYAKFSGKNTMLPVKLIDPDEVIGIVFKPGSLVLFTNEESEARLFAKLHNVDIECDSTSANGCDYRYEDVTEKAAFTLSNNLLTYENGKILTGDVAGKTSVTGKYKGKTSFLNIEIISDKMMLLMIVGPRKNMAPKCPSYHCYATSVDAPIGFSVSAYSMDMRSTIDITKSVTWEISDSTIASIETGGKFTPKKTGMIWIRATYKDSGSDKVWISVVNDTSTKFLVIGIGDNDRFPTRPLKVGETMKIYSAMYEYRKCDTDSSYYCMPVHFMGYVEAEKVVSSNEGGISYSVPEVCSYGDKVCIDITGMSTGFVSISTEAKGLKSNELTFEVWQNDMIERCDTEHPNLVNWQSSSESSAATLESDCGTYDSDDIVEIRYSAKVAGGNSNFFDNCLDMWVLDEDDNIVKTFRNEGCSTESIGRNAQKSLSTVFQVKYDWDMIADDGTKVAPGKYYATARFYILYEPVIHLPFTILE